MAARAAAALAQQAAQMAALARQVELATVAGALPAEQKAGRKTGQRAAQKAEAAEQPVPGDPAAVQPEEAEPEATEPEAAQQTVAAKAEPVQPGEAKQAAAKPEAVQPEAQRELESGAVADAADGGQQPLPQLPPDLPVTKQGAAAMQEDTWGGAEKEEVRWEELDAQQAAQQPARPALTDDEWEGQYRAVYGQANVERNAEEARGHLVSRPCTRRCPWPPARLAQGPSWPRRTGRTAGQTGAAASRLARRPS